MRDRPNLLMVVADQQRYDCVGPARMYPARTPNIDSIAAEGVWFEHAFTPLPTCCPARQALLSGRTPERLGALWNYDITLPIASISPDTPTWSADLAAADWDCSYVGKWHASERYSPRDFGYGFYYGEEHYDAWRRSAYPGRDYAEGWLGEIDFLETAESRTHTLARIALERIEQAERRGTPWHIRLDFPEPHLPCRPTKEFAERWRGAELPEWAGFRDELVGKPYIQRQMLRNWGLEGMDWSDWEPVVRRYCAAIEQYDAALGLVLGALRASPSWDSTVVVYTSDHGDLCGSHGMIDKHHVMYDDVVRVPLALRVPGVSTPGARTRAFVSNALDLSPTIRDLFGLGRMPGEAGRSLVPLLRGETPDDWPEEIVSTYNGQQFGLYAQRMIRDERWKYVWNPTDVDELYRLEADPGELRNAIDDADCAAALADLRKRLHQRLKELDDQILRGPWVEAQLLEGRKIGGAAAIERRRTR